MALLYSRLWRALPIVLLIITLSQGSEAGEGGGGGKYHQFTPGSELLRLPPILMYSLQMTTAFARRSYLPLTLESMR